MAYERADSEDNQLQLLREGMAELDARSRDIIARRWLDADPANLQAFHDTELRWRSLRLLPPALENAR